MCSASSLSQLVQWSAWIEDPLHNFVFSWWVGYLLFLLGDVSPTSEWITWFDIPLPHCSWKKVVISAWDLEPHFYVENVKRIHKWKSLHLHNNNMTMLFQHLWTKLSSLNVLEIPLPRLFQIESIVFWWWIEMTMPSTSNKFSSDTGSSHVDVCGSSNGRQAQEESGIQSIWSEISLEFPSLKSHDKNGTSRLNYSYNIRRTMLKYNVNEIWTRGCFFGMLFMTIAMALIREPPADRWKIPFYFTTWDIVLVTIYFGFATLQSIFHTDSLTSINQWLFPVVFASANMTFTVFWGIFIFDRELIHPIAV